MKIVSAEIKNFRLLSDVKIKFDQQNTVIVGRNNSGKTSLTEIVRRFLGSDSPSFQLEDFSTECHKKFLQLFNEKSNFNKEKENIDKDIMDFREKIPVIELLLKVEYDKETPDFSSISPFIVDLNENCTETIIVIRYELESGKLDKFFIGNIDLQNEKSFFQELKSRISKFFTTTVFARDPNDKDNKRELTIRDVKRLIKVNFINAQRGMNDITSRENKPLAKILENLFEANHTLNNQSVTIADNIEKALYNIQHNINENFTNKLNELFPSLETLGYPGLAAERFETEVILDVRKILSNFTSIYYPSNGIPLPESYNGLGTKNLLLILFQLAQFYKEFSIRDNTTKVHLIFIEEPEAHLHPQMQEVFIKQISEATKKLTDGKINWAPQFIISTHSSHIANSTGFEHIRYFFKNHRNETEIKDFGGDFSESEEQKDFLYKYMTLTKSDLFFADKAILVEGITERLLLPKMIEKLDLELNTNLKGAYLTVLEISGAFAHKFIPLLKFLNLKTLIITDLDSVDKMSKGKACAVHKGKSTSNACIKYWFNEEKELINILKKSDSDKINEYNNIRIAFQCPEIENGACGRSFEDSFILANTNIFKINGINDNDIETQAYKKAKKIDKKSDFAITYAINKMDWNIPKYIKDGLIWLADKREKNSNE